MLRSCVSSRWIHRALRGQRLCQSRFFADNSPGEHGAGDGAGDSQMSTVQAILEDVKAEDLQRDEAPRQASKEPTFGELLASVGLKDSLLESWFKSQNYPQEELPILEELSPREIKLREKAKRRAEELRKVKELAESRVRVVDRYGVAHATGKRKESIAIIDLKEGTGKITVNKKDHDLYFTLLDHRVHYLEPFCETNTLGKFDVKAEVRGGGISGQAGAMRHGISKALQLFDPELRRPLRKGGYLTRDPRVVERKKPGRAKARKRFQWVKR